MAKEVGALLHAGMGHASVATGLMDEAEAIVEAGADPRGAASPVKPVHELSLRSSELEHERGR